MCFAFLRLNINTAYIVQKVIAVRDGDEERSQPIREDLTLLKAFLSRPVLFQLTINAISAAEKSVQEMRFAT